MRMGATEIMMLVLILLLLFGTTRLPRLARSIREARNELEGEAEGGSDPQ